MFKASSHVNARWTQVISPFYYNKKKSACPWPLGICMYVATYSYIGDRSDNAVYIHIIYTPIYSAAAIVYIGVPCMYMRVLQGLQNTYNYKTTSYV